jgi:hypothetical protein
MEHGDEIFHCAPALQERLFDIVKIFPQQGFEGFIETQQLAIAMIYIKGYFVIVIASVSQRSNPLKIKRLLRQKAPRNDCNFDPKRV